MLCLCVNGFRRAGIVGDMRLRQEDEWCVRVEVRNALVFGETYT